ncbi:hypothetical protein SNEBB_007956 [Seison nebaliae]|nr:hypothetical protein SNEBB_007956 [Seison nebaliae]
MKMKFFSCFCFLLFLLFSDDCQCAFGFPKKKNVNYGDVQAQPKEGIFSKMKNKFKRKKSSSVPSIPDGIASDSLSSAPVGSRVPDRNYGTPRTPQAAIDRILSKSGAQLFDMKGEKTRNAIIDKSYFLIASIEILFHINPTIHNKEKAIKHVAIERKKLLSNAKLSNDILGLEKEIRFRLQNAWMRHTPTAPRSLPMDIPIETTPINGLSSNSLPTYTIPSQQQQQQQQHMEYNPTIPVNSQEYIPSINIPSLLNQN